MDGQYRGWWLAFLFTLLGLGVARGERAEWQIPAGERPRSTRPGAVSPLPIPARGDSSTAVVTDADLEPRADATRGELRRAEVRHGEVRHGEVGRGEVGRGELEWAGGPSAEAADREPLPPISAARPSRAAAAEPVFELFEFRDLPLVDALRLFSEQTGINAVASRAAGEQQVSLYLRNVTASHVIQALAKSNNLWTRVEPESGVLHVSTTEEYDRDLATFRDEQTEVFTLLYPNPVDVARTIESIFGDRVYLTLDDSRRDTQFEDLQQRFERFDMVDERGEGLGLFGTESRGAAGRTGTGRSGAGFGRSRGQDMARDVRAQRERRDTRQLPRLERFEELSGEEIAVLEAYYAEQEADWDQTRLDELLRRRRAIIYVAVIQRNNQIVVRTSDERTMEQITELIQRLDVPTPLVLLEVKILSVALGDDFNSVFDYQFSDSGTLAGGFATGDLLPPMSDNPDRIDSPRGRRDSAISPETSSAWNNVASKEDLTFQFVSDHFRFRMQLLESKNRVTTMATPLLLTANNEVSRIFIGQTEPFTIGFESPQIVATGTTQTNILGTPITELRDVGQLLLITPSINADRTVTLRIAQQQSRKSPGGASIPVLDNQGRVQQVSVDTVGRQTATGTIVAKDGLTVVLGGLIEEEVSDIRAEVPVIGKLPLVGFFFRRQATLRERRETLIMIRPYVFNTPPESAAMSEALLRELSIHPNAYDGRPTMNSHAPWEAVRPTPPCNELENRFRFHSVHPPRY